MKYTDCIFDLYGTLVDIRTEEDRPELWQGMAAYFAQFGADFAPEKLHSRYLFLVRQAELAMGAGGGDDHEAHPEIRLETVFSQLFADGNIVADDAMIQAAGRRFRELSTIFVKLYDGVPELLHTLREKGRRIWLLSNAQRMFTAYEMEQLGIIDAFDGICLSSDYGVKKPDPRFFRVLLEERGIDPASAIMVGNDGTCDIGGARPFGLATLYIRTEISPEEPLPEADYVLIGADMRRVGEILLQND